jgi:NAD-dependent SIR2 family protein deacetylase
LTNNNSNNNMFQIQGETFDKRLASVSDLISDKKNIVILAGAGISVSCGLPDFRSKDGLYNNLDYQDLGLTCAEDLFDINAFSEDPRPFWKFVRKNNFASDKITPSASHLFLAWLDQQDMLLRIYTQNIDGLEQSAGVDENKIVYAHGSFTGATCMKCKAKYQSSEIASDVDAGIPVCHRRTAKKGKVSQNNIAKANSVEIPPERRSSRKRSCTQSSSNHTEFHPPSVEKGCCGGIIKPNITFFGEKLDNTISRRLEEDYKKADALIVMGTSLSV